MAIRSVTGVRLVAVGTEFRSAIVVAAIERLRNAGTRSGMFFDFDGVLSRIQDDPESVRPTEGAQSELEALRGLVGRIAVVSSRPADFLKTRFEDIELYGLYGLEHAEPGGSIVVEPAAREWITVVRTVRSEADEALPGVYVEDKTLSVALHYRRAPDARDAVEEWAREAAERTGLRLQPGRMAVELKPPLDIDKGSVVTRLIADLNAAWYFGDDLGDLPAFAALHKKTEGGDFDGIAVGVGNDTVIEAVRAESDIFLESPESVVELLRFVRQELTV